MRKTELDASKSTIKDSITMSKDPETPSNRSRTTEVVLSITQTQAIAVLRSSDYLRLNLITITKVG